MNHKRAESTRSDGDGNLPPPANRTVQRRRKILFWVCWGYLGILLVLWIVLRVGGDRWWPATLMMFGPRWLAALPLMILMPLAWIVSRRLLWVMLLAAGVCAIPILGFCVPWRRAVSSPPSVPRVRVLTCNVHWGDNFKSDAFYRLVQEQRPDVVTLQEYGDAAGRAFAEPGWHIVCTDELFLASRFPVRDLGPVSLNDLWQGGHSHRGTAHLYQLDVSGRMMPFIQVHLASPHNDFSAAVRVDPSAAQSVEENSSTRMFQAHVVGNLAQRAGADVLLAGDFNTPVESTVFHQTFGGLADAFSVAGWGFGWTYYHRGAVVRIDHILSGSGWRCTGCRVLGNVGSPHRPLMADFSAIDRPSTTVGQ